MYQDMTKAQAEALELFRSGCTAFLPARLYKVEKRAVVTFHDRTGMLVPTRKQFKVRTMNNLMSRLLVKAVMDDIGVTWRLR